MDSINSTCYRFMAIRVSKKANAYRLASGFLIRRWPNTEKHVGLAHGWPGWAWVWLNLVETGHLAYQDRTARAILRRLQEGKSSTPYISNLIGSGSYPLVAALGARTDAAFLKLLPRLVDHWITSCTQTEHRDVMVGSAGALLTCAEIEGLVPGRISPKFISSLHQILILEVKRLVKEASHGRPVYLGFAHGLAGHLFALEMSRACFGSTLNSSLREQCIELIAEESRSAGNRTALWPSCSGIRDIDMHGWCNGGPGIGLALLCGFYLTGFKTYWEIARRALEGTFRFKDRRHIFCCGSAGRAQILIEAYRITRNKVWLAKAKQVAVRMSLKTRRRLGRGFHKGILGHEYLKWRFSDPQLPLPGLGILSLSTSAQQTTQPE